MEAWKEEREKLTAERSEFSREYATLKEQVLAAENVRWETERIVRGANTPQKDLRRETRKEKLQTKPRSRSKMAR
jgi:hypothetical protein